MGLTIGIISAVVGAGSAGYSISKSEQASRDAKKQAQTLIDSAPNAAADNARAATAASAAGARQRAKATSPNGFSGTILTGGRGIPAPAPTEKKTLLGL